MVCFLTALREEHRALEAVFPLIPAGTLGNQLLFRGPGCASLCCGMGPERILRGARMLQRAFSPRMLVLAGFCVGLSPELVVGDAVAESASDQDTLARLRELDGQIQIGGLAECGFLLKAREKARAAVASPACLAADMESRSFVRALQGQQRFFVIRTVSDTVNTSLPLDFSSLQTSAGFPDQARIIRKTLSKPSLIPSMVELARDSHRASEALRQFFQRNRAIFEDLGSARAELC